MGRFWVRWLVMVFVALGVILFQPLVTVAQAPSPPATASLEVGTVTLKGQPLFRFTTSLASQTPEARAIALSNHLQTFADNPALPLSALQVGDQGGATVIFYGISR